MNELSILFLFIPLAWELVDDHKGDTNHKQDVYIRIILACFMGEIVRRITGHYFGTCVMLSLAIHFALFDYLVAIVLKKFGVISPNAHWFTYLGKSAEIDKDKLWIKMGAWLRLGVRVVCLASSIYFYTLH